MLSIRTQGCSERISTSLATQERFFRFLETITSRELEFIIVEASREFSHRTWEYFSRCFLRSKPRAKGYASSSSLTRGSWWGPSERERLWLVFWDAGIRTDEHVWTLCSYYLLCFQLFNGLEPVDPFASPTAVWKTSKRGRK